jgi:putative addiction module component (TIGR02574 family)
VEADDMSLASKDIFEIALELPEGERLDLAAALLAASEPPTPELAGESWLAEIDRRSQEIDSGSVSCISWEQVKQAARGQHGR